MTVPPSASSRPADGRGVLRVVSGDVTPEEIAAVVAAVATATSSTDRTASADGGPARPPAISVWSAPGYAHRNVRTTFAPGPDSWRTSFWPR